MQIHKRSFLGEHSAGVGTWQGHMGCRGGQGEAASPEIAANVGHHIGVVALTQDSDFLLEGADVVPWGAQGIVGGGRSSEGAP